MQSQPTTLLCRYGYDPLDRLIATAQPSATERQRFYCKSRLATEIEGALRYSIVQHGDQLLAEQQSEGDAPVAMLLATDQQRSVLQTLKADDQQHAIAYSPYGHRLIESGLLSLMGFNGERPDPVTGHYLLGNGYRAFNPVLMRFNGPDSLSPFGKGGLNPYAYCLGNPVNSNDQTGHIPRFLSRLFGIDPPPSFFGTRYMSKPGISPKKAQRAYSRIVELEGQIPDVLYDAQLKVFSADKITVNTAAEHTPFSLRLEQMAYRASRPESQALFSPADIAKNFSHPHSKIVRSAATTDHASYRSLFERLDRITDTNITTRLELINHDGLDPAIVTSYTRRMESIRPQDHELRAELARIRKTNFVGY